MTASVPPPGRGRTHSVESSSDSSRVRTIERPKPAEASMSKQVTLAPAAASVRTHARAADATADAGYERVLAFQPELEHRWLQAGALLVLLRLLLGALLLQRFPGFLAARFLRRLVSHENSWFVRVGQLGFERSQVRGELART